MTRKEIVASYISEDNSNKTELQKEYNANKLVDLFNSYLFPYLFMGIYDKQIAFSDIEEMLCEELGLNRWCNSASINYQTGEIKESFGRTVVYKNITDYTFQNEELKVWLSTDKFE